MQSTPRQSHGLSDAGPCKARSDAAIFAVLLLAVSISSIVFFAGWMLLASATLGAFLLALAAFDLKTGRLPNQIMLPLILLGLGVNGAFGLDRLTQALLGAVLGFVSLALVRFAYKAWRGREGLGGGDVKLFAAAGAWVGATQLPLVLSIAALSGLVLVLLQSKQTRELANNKSIPFGPHLAVGLWVTWIWM